MWRNTFDAGVKSKDILTTGEVARICKVAPRTVSKWFDSGQLRGYRIPGSKDRRIPRSELRVFMDRHGIPQNGLESEGPLALVVGNNSASGKQQIEALLVQNRFDVQSAESAFAAGILAERLKPCLIIWDIDGEGQNGARVPNNIRDVVNFRQSGLIVLTSSKQQSRELVGRGFQVCLSEPLDDSLLVSLIAQSAAKTSG